MTIVQSIYDDSDTPATGRVITWEDNERVTVKWDNTSEIRIEWADELMPVRRHLVNCGDENCPGHKTDRGIC